MHSLDAVEALHIVPDGPPEGGGADVLVLPAGVVCHVVGLLELGL